MPAGSFGLGMGSMGGGASPFSTINPYLQMALAAYGGLTGTSGTETLGNRLQGQFGSQARLPSQPSSQSRGQQTARAVGTAALNFVPVVGPALSIASSLYGGNKDTKASQEYMKRFLSANPDITDPVGIGLKSEFVPQTNTAARIMQGMPAPLQKADKWLDKKLGSRVSGALTPLAHIGLGAEKKQKKRQEHIRKRNLGLMEDEQEASAFKARNAQGRGETSIMPFLMQILGPKFGQMGQQTIPRRIVPPTTGPL